MENQIQVFEHEQFGSVRVLEIDCELWFVGRDAALGLGYKNPNDALEKHVDNEDKLVSQIAIAGQARNVMLINEGGLYSLAVRSKLAGAKKFTRWLTHDVAISIRKTGFYQLPANDPRSIFTPTFIRQIADRIETLENQVAELKPDAEYCRNVLQSKGFSPTVQTLWTQKGRNFLYNELKRHGVLPLSERENPQSELF